MNKYPEWAPKILVDEYEYRTTKTARERLDYEHGPDQVMDRLIASEHYQKSQAKYLAEGLSAASLKKTEEKVRTQLQLQNRSLPGSISTPLLYKVITDPAMKLVWTAIKKRIKEENDYYEFWKTCETGILEWKKDQKLSYKQHVDYCRKISNLAKELSDLMEKDKLFYDYSGNKKAHREIIPMILKMLDTPSSGFKDEDERINYADQWISLVIPPLSSSLRFLSIDAELLSMDEQRWIVKEPKSENAHVHYFVRTLSQYCKKKYEQPLHEVVATTTAVVLDKENITSDYVKKLVM